MSTKDTTYDKRKALPEGFELTIAEKNPDNAGDNIYKITIQRKIASGGSCLVYRGSLKKLVGDEKATYDVIVKEVYPKRLDEEITRSDGYKINFASEEGKCEYESFLSHFCKGQVKHIVYASNNSENALPPLFCSGVSEETRAFYAVSRVATGEVLSEINLKDYSIVKALELSMSLCEAIGKVHEGGRNNDCQYSLGLYLDCKPDNIFVLNNRAYLFDFDTVQPNGDLSFCSYSEGWSAPEQKINSATGYSDVRKIGYHTDIFSIGSVLFYMLTGDNPYEAGLDAIHEGFDWKNRIILKDTTDALEDEEFITELNQVMTLILEEKAENRKINYSNSSSTVSLLKDLRSLIRLAQTVTIKNESKEIKSVFSESSSIMRKDIKQILQILIQNQEMIDNASEIGASSKNTALYNSKGVIIYDGDIKNGRRHGHGTEYREDGTIKLEGDWKNDVLNGKSVIYDSNGVRIYEGEFCNGKPNGSGSCYRADGSIAYEGGYLNGKYHGHGTYFYENGTIMYEGEWKENECNGPGTEYREDGSILYKGEYKNNKINGHGTSYYENGSILYEGEFKEGKVNGQGKLFRKDGSLQFAGTFKDNLPNGHGTEFYENSSVLCEGEYKEGQLNDQDIIYREYDFLLFDGTFKDNKPDECCTSNYEICAIKYEGEWKDGNRNGMGKLFVKDGSLLFAGTFKDNLPNGHGTLFGENGTILFEGEYKDGKWNGHGKIYDDDGFLHYKGECKDDKRHGHGTEFYEDGSKYVGFWKNGLRHGYGIEYGPDGKIVNFGRWRKGLKK